MATRDIDDIRQGSVACWHPWQDRPGMPKLPVFWSAGAIESDYGKLYTVESMERVFETVARRELFVLCQDILQERELPFINELLGDKRSVPYLSRTANCSALRVSSKRHSGFFVPTSTWLWDEPPCKELTQNLMHIFDVCGYQSTTPSSLSEKLLRSTLPEKLHISRPSVMLRRDILDNHVGGRIESAEPCFYTVVRKYDKNKAYLSLSRMVPSPWQAPVVWVHPKLDEIGEYPTGFWQCVLIARERTIAPIQVNGLAPVEGEVIERWLWTEELIDCLNAGYLLLKIRRGYGFRSMSTWMCAWADLLWEKYQRETDPHIKRVFKQMMVGLPGRFLKAPETYALINIDQGVIPGDIPLPLHWIEPEDRKFSDYVIRPEYDKESTALSPIGSYIVMRMRQELYHLMLLALAQRRKIIMAYIDCVSVDGELDLGDDFGELPGQYKVEKLANMFAESNHFVAESELDPERLLLIKAPGMANDLEDGKRLALLQKYWKIRAQFVNQT